MAYRRFFEITGFYDFAYVLIANISIPIANIFDRI